MYIFCNTGHSRTRLQASVEEREQIKDRTISVQTRISQQSPQFEARG